MGISTEGGEPHAKSRGYISESGSQSVLEPQACSFSKEWDNQMFMPNYEWASHLQGFGRTAAQVGREEAHEGGLEGLGRLWRQGSN